MGTGPVDSIGIVENPLLNSSPAAWDQLIEAVGPASLLIVIETRMSAALKHRHTSEDVLQEALLHAWRDRRRCQWRGLRAFRSWLLTIIDNRIRDLAAHESAQKRGGGAHPVPFSVLEPDQSGGSHYAGPIASTTPSRVAAYREQAEAMQTALEGLPDEVREVVRLRLFEQLAIDEIADRLGLGPSAVRHRFRRGAEQFRRKLISVFATRSQAVSDFSAPAKAPDSATDK